MDNNSKQHNYYHPNQQVSLSHKLQSLRQRVNPQDILTNRSHSRDFCNSRAEYISIRIRTLAFIFAVLAPIWVPIDYMVMDSVTFQQFLMLRLGFSASFLALTVWGTQCSKLAMARLRIALFILIPGLFYFASHTLLPNNSSDNAILLGYSFLPLLVMALMAIVPLTLLEGVSFLGLIIAIFVGTQLFDNSLFELTTMGQLWLLVLLGTVALWVEITQLHMLMRLYREATRDALTGLINRRVLAGKIEQELASHHSAGDTLCVMLFDLDLFKRINDTHGHHTGDLVLQAFAEILQEHCRDTFVAGRYGGEEFLAILPHCGVETATQLAEQIRSACHQVTVCSSDDQEVNFTTSVGVAQLKEKESAQMLLTRVDEGLYKAKAAGRDFVAVAE